MIDVYIMVKDKESRMFTVTSVNQTFFIRDDKGRIVLEAKAKDNQVVLSSVDLTVFKFSQIASPIAPQSRRKRRKVSV